MPCGLFFIPDLFHRLHAFRSMGCRVFFPQAVQQRSDASLCGICLPAVRHGPGKKSLHAAASAQAIDGTWTPTQSSTVRPSGGPDRSGPRGTSGTTRRRTLRSRRQKHGQLVRRHGFRVREGLLKGRVVQAALDAEVLRLHAQPGSSNSGKAGASCTLSPGPAIPIVPAGAARDAPTDNQISKPHQQIFISFQIFYFLFIGAGSRQKVPTRSEKYKY